MEVLWDEKELCEIAAENNLNPNMARNRKKCFLENVSAAFEDSRKAEKKTKKKESARCKETTRTLKALGQLTLERDFFQV